MLSDSTKIKLLGRLMAFLQRHPLLVRLLLRPIANAPIISKKMMVFVRAFMGATAFELHDVDLRNGRIGIGGVEEIMAGSKLIELLHTTLGEALDEEAKNRALYSMGQRLCRWEVGQALEHGRWAPAVLAPLIFNSRVIDEVQADPQMAEFFGHVMRMMSRLITDEGGWGHLDFDFSAYPLKVMLTNSQEARWLGPADRPTCHFYAGIVSGYASTISGQELTAVEVECKSMGASRCVFELSKTQTA
ncbi:MAG: 4-vinyl reductase [Candidatus Alcyoniella australis]|nr:4-vinyl reductase [Candidatus Alcyoniella australis]